jgi:hypothetical protein
LTRPFARAVAALVAIQLAGAAAAQPREEELRELRTRIDALKKELVAEGARAEAADARATRKPRSPGRRSLRAGRAARVSTGTSRASAARRVR